MRNSLFHDSKMKYRPGQQASMIAKPTMWTVDGELSNRLISLVSTVPTEQS